MKIEIAVCDADSLFCKQFCRRINTICEKHKVSAALHTFSCAESLLAFYEKSGFQFDIIFLEIQLPGMNGKQAAHLLRQKNSFFQLAFVSAQEQEVFAVFQYGAACFLPKAKWEAQLEESLLRLLQQAKPFQRGVRQWWYRDAQGHRGLVRMPVQEIYCVESCNRSVLLHTKNAAYELTQIQFSQLEQELVAFGFVKSHRTCLLNPQHVFCVDDTGVLLDNQTRLPLSRRRKTAVLNAVIRLPVAAQ